MAAHDRMWQVNYNGTVHCCRAFARQMIPRKAGRHRHHRLDQQPPAAADPGLQHGQGRHRAPDPAARCELGRHGIRVNSVGPTYVMTPPLRAKVASGERDMSKMMAVHALPRLPEPADIAAAIAFLASDQAKAITGILLPIDAGWLAAVSYRTYAGGVPWTE